jgi:pyruvate kinase
MRKTKIVATLGPASDSEEMIQKLIEAGVDALRFNFSHGTHEQHLISFHRARTISEELGKTVALIMDLQGPKIRVGTIEDEPMQLEAGSEIVLTSRRVRGSRSLIPVSYDNLETDVKENELILMDDGRLRLKVINVSDEGVRCLVLEGGPLRSHKGVNFPGTKVSVPSVTLKDLEDLAFGLQLGFDCVALSFVSGPSDITDLRKRMESLGTVRPILAKLERAACLENLDAILEVSDAVMVARGDLGVEVDIKRVPVLQKQIIAKANMNGIPVITATQMLESMTQGLLPTRAEAADVANAVLDGTDALMLSGETSVGDYPVQTVTMMNNIIIEAEKFHAEYESLTWMRQKLQKHDAAEAICHTSVVAAHDLGLQNIVVITRTGQTALDVAKFRPKADIQAFAFDYNVRNFLAITRGGAPHVSQFHLNFEELMDIIDRYLIDEGICKMDEKVAVVLGVPIGQHKSTNTLTIHRTGAKWTSGHSDVAPQQ